MLSQLIGIREMSFRKDSHDSPSLKRVLPRLERSSLSVILSTSSVFLSERNLLRLFRWETRKLDRLLEADDSYDVSQIINIPRVIGVSESNRNWSVLMVLDHLCLVIEDCRKAIVALSDGVEPRGEIDLSFYAPSEDVGFEVIGRFEHLTGCFCRDIQSAINGEATFLGPAQFSHPCFGTMNAKRWLAFAALHQVIHRRQVQKIIVMLGIT